MAISKSHFWESLRPPEKPAGERGKPASQPGKEESLGDGKPEQAKPKQAKPKQAKPEQAKPGQAIKRGSRRFRLLPL